LQADAMPGCELRGDVLAFAGLRVRLQRIGLDHWRAGSTLRSWGAAPLYRDGDALLAPCAADEALWLGAWLDDDEAATAASIELTSTATGHTALLALPGFQVAGLADPHGRQHPITLPAEHPALDLRLRLRAGPAQADCRLRLCTPQAWSAAAGRPAPEALTGPPPLPPRLG
jgi:hypothetical protein